jgi:RimJ/RimL family protein N-acetyltransferase
MTDYMLEVARDKAIRTIYASVLRDNLGMIHMLKRRGFTLKLDEENTAFSAELDLENAMPFATELPF